MATDLSTTGQEIDLVMMRGQQDAELCSVLLEQVLARFGLEHRDLGGSWKDMRKKLVLEACKAAVDAPVFQHAEVLRGHLEQEIARLHVRAVVRVSIAVLVKDGLDSFDDTEGAPVINGVSDEILEESSVKRVIDRLIAEFRINPRRMAFSDYLQHVR